MNVSQYKLNERLARDAIASLSLFASVEESIVAAGKRASETPVEQQHGEKESFATGGALYTYALDPEGNACILSCESTEPSITVPAVIRGHHVTAVGGHAFSTCYSLERIDLPDGIVSIGRHAFMNTGLREFTAPPNLRAIGESAFYKCANLRSVLLNNELATIGVGAFKESALASLSLPASVEFIGQNAFLNTRMALGDNPTLRINPENPNLIFVDGALYAKNVDGSLVLVQVIDEGVKKFEALTGTTFVVSKAISNLRKLEHISFPEGTLTLGDKAFTGCKALTSVELPSTLRSIGRQAFQDTALRELRIPAELSEIGVAAFYTGGSIARKHTPTIKRVEVDPRNTHFFMHDGILCHRTENGVTAVIYLGTAEHLAFPREITSIGMYAFLNCSTIKAVELHDGIRSIDVGGLDTGRSITSIVYNVYGGKECVQERYVVNFPPGLAGREAAKLTFSRGQFNLRFAYEAADDAILATQDTCLRGKAILERLRNPIMLSESTRAAFKRRLRRAVPATVVAFGQNGYPEGIDFLYEEGVICEENIDELVQAASDAGEIAVLSRLMELKRTAFEARMFDFDL